MSTPSAPMPTPPSRPAALRRFGRFSLQRLAGKSRRTMAWYVGDPDSGQDLLLVLPRVVPSGEALESWLQRCRRAARLDHPHLAAAVEVGASDGWPYAAYSLIEEATLIERIGTTGMACAEAASVAERLLQALAFAHDAGVVHRDLQGFMVLVNDKGSPRLTGLEVAFVEGEASVSPNEPDAQSRIAQRTLAQTDVLQTGVLMHHMLIGQPALEESDTGLVVERLPPIGREVLRLAFTTPRPIPEALRVIVNRAVDRQERRRYRNARTLARALEGWLQADHASEAGPLALVLDRIRAAGVLPASPGGAERAARLAQMERGRTDELAQVLLDDVALAFELLRAVNTAQVRGTQVSGNGAVLTVRRSIAMIGLDGVRRVAWGLRPWPGPLQAAAAAELARLLERAKRAARVAAVIRPAGYDAEVVYLLALLQNLGRLVVQYHLPDEAAQIQRLTQSASAPDGEDEEPGMSEQAASMAVLGVDLEAIGSAVARWWGLDDNVLHMMRRHSLTAAVRNPEGDGDQLRLSASCANEAVDALALPATQVMRGLQLVVQRYGRVLGLTLKDLQAALKPGAGLDAMAGDAPPAPRRASGPEQRAAT